MNYKEINRGDTLYFRKGIREKGKITKCIVKTVYGDKCEVTIGSEKGKAIWVKNDVLFKTSKELRQHYGLPLTENMLKESV